ncbi:MAG: polyhydroxyalkanoic acid system family protein [bacterium]
MHFEVPHTLSQEHAVARIKVGLLQAAPHLAQNKVVIEKQTWEGNTLNFAVTLQGKEVTGTVQVLEKQFIIDAKLPLLWRMFEGKIEKMIAEQAAGMLGK